MLRLLSKALLALALLTGGVAAQTLTLPELGLQSTGACRQLAARDRTNGAMVPLGCLDTTRHVFSLMGDASIATATAGSTTQSMATWLGSLAPKASPVFTGTPSMPAVNITGSGSTGDASSFTVPATPNTNVTLGALISQQPVTWAFLHGILPSASASSNRTNLLAALSAGVKSIQFGPGTYTIDNGSGPVLIDLDGVNLLGAGRTSTFLQGTSLTGDFIQFGTGGAFRNGLTLKDMTIQGPASGTMTGGFAITTNNTFALTLSQVRVLNYCNGIDTYNAQSPIFTDVYLGGACPSTGKFITARGSGTGFNMFLTRVATDGGPGTPQPAAGLYVENFDGIFATDTQFNRSGTALDFNPPKPGTGRFPNFSHFLGKGVSLDTSTTAGLLVRGTGYVFDIKCIQCFIDSNGNAGVQSTNNNLDGFYFTSGEVKGNNTHGFYFQNGGSGITIVDTLIAGNNINSLGTYSGVQFGNGTFNDVRVMGNRIGPAANLADTQSYAISTDNGGGQTLFDRSQFINNNLAGNVLGRMSANFFASSFTERYFIGNVGMKTETSGVAVITSGTSVVTVTHGLPFTPYINDISVTPNTTIASNFWVDSVTSTTFQIHTGSNVSAATPLSWIARAR